MPPRAEAGFTIVELLVVTTVCIVILGATLTTFASSYRGHHENDARNDSAERVRDALDVQARQLRNLAKRLNNQPVIDRIAPNDVIFQTSDPARTWVRYCLDTTTPPASASRGRLWTAQFRYTGSGPSGVTTSMRAGCPGTGWTRTSVVADDVSNAHGGAGRPLFTYLCTSGTSACTASPATYDQVVGVRAQTFLDTTPGRGPAELSVSSGVALRNQNQAPEARFAATPSSKSRTVVLNAAGSFDHEGRTLSYHWFVTTMPTSIDCTAPRPAGASLWGGTYLGEGITLTHTFALTAGVTGTPHAIGLVACDPGDRFGTAGVPPQAPILVAIPS